ncbi:MAG: osmotically-inducible protein OsmY [Candidatus Azotimanducaceae bacterium]|jgi:osmotically-inducible protein OsmY|tara:strand:+ start:2756 stop:3313 length:558 start_codon:yes stop_codon:yes gene_type:complete
MMNKISTNFLLLLCLSLVACTSNPERQRSAGTIIDDNVLEIVIGKEIRAADEGYKGAHIVVTVYDGLVLLLGQVASEELKRLATDTTEGLSKVDAGSVHNHLTVEGPISLLARTNDSVLSGKVKTRLLAEKSVPGTKIKVKTQNAIIYLLGKITVEQADAAVAATQKSFGVRKIVKVFDYVESAE